MKTILPEQPLKSIMSRLSKNLQVRRKLTGVGRLHIDRLLPFICVYRKPVHGAVPGTDRFVVTSASYLIAGGSSKQIEETDEVLSRVAGLMTERFGAFLLLELWSSPGEVPQPDHEPPGPAFHIYFPDGDDMPDTLDTARESFAKIRISKQPAVADMSSIKACSPPGMKPFVKTNRMDGVYWMGLEVSPIHIDPETGEPFPLLLRSLRRQVGQALGKIFFEFSRECTTHQPPHFHTLGRHAMVKAVWDIDRRLDEVGSSFDLLHQITPVNVEKEWLRFQRARFEKPPHFLYRPRPVDPGAMKARLYSIPIDRIEDPTLMNLFFDKQREIDRQLTLLMDRGRPAFMYGSLQLYGAVADKTIRAAESILENMSGRPRRSAEMLDAVAIQALAAREIAAYRDLAPTFEGSAMVSDDLYAGLLVSQGRLLIGRDAVVPAHRVHALMQHEVGTHIVTRSNGRAQPFRLLASGLPGYDGLQEGLAVLAEYLTGGLDTARLRLLAIRVLAVHALEDGASFIEVFRLLTDEYGFTRRSAYLVAMRVFRGGGCTKDVVYLRGLLEVLNYLGNGGGFESLFAGKFALSHLPMIEELLHRRILVPPVTLPLYLNQPDARRRLDKVRKGLTVLQLGNVRANRRKS